MLTRLFNRGQAEAYQVVEGVKNVTFGHTCGGEARHQGTTPAGCPKPVHLFYDLDLSDPRVSIPRAVPGVTRLPLYYALGNLGGPFQYRVVSDDRIELLCKPYPKKYRAGILKDYPEPLPREPVELNPRHYDPTDPADLWDSGGVLGIAALTARQKAAVRKKFERWHLKTLGWPLVEQEEGEEVDLTLDDLVADCTPFTQGMPQDWCPNPKCPQHKTEEPLPPLVLLEPDEDDDFFERIAGGDRGQLLWQVCPQCLSVVVNNPCT